MSYTIKTVDFKKEKRELIRILIAQPAWTKNDWEVIDGLYFHDINSSVKVYVEKILEKAKQFGVTLIVFPELSIPENLVNIICAWAYQNDCIVIAGSHYINTEKGYISKAPVIFENNIYYSEKIVPAPFEISPFPDEGLKSGETILIFKNSYLGDFSLLICSDYLATDLRAKLFELNIDFLFVPAFQKKSEIYHERMHVDCESSIEGIYLVYANNLMTGLGDGKSAFFSLMDNTFREKFIGRTTNGVPHTKIVELDNETDFIILEINTKHKKPTLGKTVHSRPNVTVLNSIAKKKMEIVEQVKDQKVDISQLKQILKSDILVLISKHGLDDFNWLKAPSSQLFLSNIARSLGLTESEEYKNLIDSFYQFFTPRHDDSLALLESRVLITPDESTRIIQSMALEDEMDPYYKSSSKTISSNINPNQLHENYLYGVALGISSLSPSKFMVAVTNSAINYLIYKKSPNSLDNHGGWYPYRVPWITARILTSLSTVDYSDRPDASNITDIIDMGLNSLIRRLHSEGYWRSGVGTWVTKWESTALCLEAFLNADRQKKYKVVIETLIERLVKNNAWLLSKPDFTSEDATNETLSSVLMIAVLLESKRKYGLAFLISEHTEASYLNFCKDVIQSLITTEDIEIRQFCTIPQIVAYCLLAIR